MQLLQLQEKSLKEIQACMGIFSRLFFFRGSKSCVFYSYDFLSYNNSYFKAHDSPGVGEGGTPV